MVKSLDTLVEDIYKVVDETNPHDVSEENVERAGEELKTLLRTFFQERKQRTLRFSNMGKPDRQLWYSINRPETAEAMPPHAIIKFLYGHMIELVMLFLTREAGHTVERCQEEVEVDGVKGHIDAVIDGVVTDVKSASPFSFQKFADGKFLYDDPFGYIPQISGYTNLITPGEGGAFLVANKVLGNVTVARVGRGTVSEHDPATRIAHVRTILASPEEPSRCYDDVPEGKSGNRKLAIGCQYCSHKFHCWRDANGGKGLQTYQYSHGHVYLTHVQKEPRVERITPF